MRNATAKRIDALHDEINRLIEMEKKYHAKKNPEENEFLRSVRETKFEYYRHPPQMRESMVYAAATFPKVP